MTQTAGVAVRSRSELPQSMRAMCFTSGVVNSAPRSAPCRNLNTAKCW
jgi:hypothetical protein